MWGFLLSVVLSPGGYRPWSEQGILVVLMPVVCLCRSRSLAGASDGFLRLTFLSGCAVLGGAVFEGRGSFS